MANLKDEILQILERARDGKILTREILEFTKGGVPVCILICETRKSIKEMQKAVSELIDADKILVNPLNKPDKYIKLSDDIKVILKQYISNVEDFISAIIAKNPAKQEL